MPPATVGNSFYFVKDLRQGSSLKSFSVFDRTATPYRMDPFPAWYSITLMISAGISCSVLYGIYNAFFHPLSKYPGPPLWTSYRLLYTIRNIQGVLPFRILEFHRRYGPVVRIAPNELSFIDKAAWQDIYGLLPDRTQNRKDRQAYTPDTPGRDQGIIHANDVDHARLRKIYAPAFSSQALEEQSKMLKEFADLLVTQLQKAASKTPVQDMTRWYNFVTFDITGRFAIGEEFHCLENADYHFFVKAVNEGVVAGLILAQLDRYGIFTMMRPFLPANSFKVARDMDQYTRNLVKKRLETGVVPGKGDVFNHLIDQRKDLSVDEFVDNATILTVAGSETTATLLCGLTWFLCHDEAVLRKLQDEIRTAFHTSDAITVKSVASLEYLQAVLHEGMRIFPPTAFGLPRIISHKAGQMVAGHFVPHETRCAVWHWAAYHSASNFSRPDEFLPERWLNPPAAEFRSDDREMLQPWLVGPRACLGKNLTIAEMRLLLVKMVWHFDFELSNPDDDWFSRLKAYNVWTKGQSLRVRLEPVR